MLYRVKGTSTKKVNMLHESNSVDKKGNFIWVDKKTYYIEAVDFKKATTKAKKLLNHIHEVRQVEGEFVDEL